MSWKKNAPAGNRGLSKFVRLDGNTRYLPLKPISQFCQGFVSAFTSPVALLWHRIVSRIREGRP